MKRGSKRLIAGTSGRAALSRDSGCFSRDAEQTGRSLLMSSSRPVVKVIAIGYNTEGTGLTRVMNSIMRRLADRHEIHFLGLGYSGSIIRHQRLTIYPTNPNGGDVFAAFQAMRMIEEIKPDLLFIMHDIWVFE